MKLKVVNLENKAAGEIDLDDGIFGAPLRKDLLARAVNYQLAKRRQGTHKTKTRGEINGSTARPWRQKGTGRARAGDRKAGHWRGGQTTFGPQPRDHSMDLPKKVRKLALKVALSSKCAEGKLVVLDAASASEPKTKAIAAQLKALGLSSALIVDGTELDRNFQLAARNIHGVDLLPQNGANVYDILRRDTLVLTRQAVEQLQERLR
ncbi:MAG: 50S ribosomal protein L4 [Rhodospirillaceae bacterium]|jgi:large subunit ribosomal protein L4|nr:50S ribosomal protein L4 [Rhodospirillaceae bacterium]MBT6537325.1 50S ribosomal protein L4 [Rhodospirillaceae bacterium]